MSIHELAKRQLADYDRHNPGMLFAGNQTTLSVGEAYWLQREVARLRQARGEPVAGYKIGCVSATMQAQLGLDRPVFGHIFGSELHRSGVTLDSSHYDGLAIEGELCLRLAEDVPTADWLRDHRRQAIASAFAVIELHNYVFRNSPHNAQELIGNNAIHAGVVLPFEEALLHDPDDLLDEPLSVRNNGQLLGTATSRTLPGGPFGSLLRLTEHLEQFGETLHRGQLALTGSTLPLYRVSKGDRVEVICGRFGGCVEAVVSR